MESKFKSGQEEDLFNRELDGRILPPPKVWESIEVERRKEREAVLSRIKNQVEKYTKLCQQPKSIQQLELAQSSFDFDEIWGGIEVLLSGYMTMGEKTYQFEQEWSEWLGVPFSLMVNSGSSANLLAMATLAFNGIESHLKPGDEVIVPSVAWSTSIFPVAQIGCIPVFVDVDLDTVNMSVAEVQKALSPRTRAIIPVHILGNPCDMQAIMEIAQEHNLFVIEDCCESHGASVNGKKVGTWGDIGTFSFFFSHHITTVEGGMVSVKDKERWADVLTSMRAHGWARGRTDREALAFRRPWV
jgi:CDP-6-deoxy-D-xylo-4-hexulose-3-dehydrase